MRLAANNLIDDLIDCCIKFLRPDGNFVTKSLGPILRYVTKQLLVIYY